MAEQLLRLLQELDDDQFQHFKFLLEHSARSQAIPHGDPARASCPRTVELMLQHYAQHAMSLARKLLERIPRLDLVQQFRPLQD